MKIIKRDKKVETIIMDDEGEEGGAWLLVLPLNIIPKKSPSSLLEDPPLLPLLEAPVTVPPPLKPGNRSPLSLFNNLVISTQRKVLFLIW